MDKTIIGSLETAITIAVVTAAAVYLDLNAASAGFLLLVAILFIASRRSLLIATIGSVAATLAYNFFFFTPKRTLHIDDPANWIVLVSFLVTSIIANRLLVRQRAETERARTIQQEVEALYGVSVDLLKATGGMTMIGEAAARWISAMGAASGGLILFGASAQQQQVVAWTGAETTDEIEDLAAGVGRHRRFTEIPSPFGRDSCAPLILRGKAVGVLIVRGSRTTRNALESVAALTALAVERERFISERAHLEALRERDELRTSLLRAVAHDLNSPLTVLTMESDAIARRGLTDPAVVVHFETMREQLAQLKRRIENLLSVARIEAGIIHPRAEPTPAADVFRAARENLALVVRSRTIRTSIETDAPDALVDPSLALEIVVNLVENAHSASPAGSELELRSRRSLDDPRRVWLEVLDRGNGFSQQQQRALRTVGLSDTDRGLGLELARTLAILSGGSVEWFSREGGGTIARIDLPAAADLEIAS
jgi:two-component system sensor histidine kinase KdpD